MQLLDSKRCCAQHNNNTHTKSVEGSKSSGPDKLVSANQAPLVILTQTIKGKSSKGQYYSCHMALIPAAVKINKIPKGMTHDSNKTHTHTHTHTMTDSTQATDQRKANQPAPFVPTRWSQFWTGYTKQNNKTTNRTKHVKRPAGRSYKATQRTTNNRTTALEWPVLKTPGGFKSFFTV